MLNGPSNTWVCAAEPGQAVSDALGAVTFLCHIFWSKKVTWGQPLGSSMSVKVLSKTSNPGTATLRAVSPPHVVSEVWKGAPRQWKGRGRSVWPDFSGRTARDAETLCRTVRALVRAHFALI